MSDSEHSTVLYISISLDSDPAAWGISLLDTEEVPEIDPYDEDDGDEEEEEHLAPADSTAIASLAVDHVPSAEETKPFETDKSAATPPPPPPAYRTTSRMPVPSKQLYRFLLRAAEIRLRAASPLPTPTSPPTDHPLPLPTPSTSRRANIPRADIPPRKRLLLTAHTPRFRVGESSATARQPGSTVTCRVDYSLWILWMLVSERDRAALRDEVDTLRRYLFSLCTTHEQERVEARQALARAIMRIQALEAGARVDTLEDTGSSA
nr:hypothetical protein [Tanacetum cinerariifolium]